MSCSTEDACSMSKQFSFARALTSSFAIPMLWLSLASSTKVFNKHIKVFTFEMESKGTKRLWKKQLAQILHLPPEGPFEVFSSDQMLQMLNEGDIILQFVLLAVLRSSVFLLSEISSLGSLFDV